MGSCSNRTGQSPTTPASGEAIRIGRKRLGRQGARTGQSGCIAVEQEQRPCPPPQRPVRPQFRYRHGRHPATTLAGTKDVPTPMTILAVLSANRFLLMRRMVICVLAGLLIFHHCAVLYELYLGAGNYEVSTTGQRTGRRRTTNTSSRRCACSSSPTWRWLPAVSAAPCG